MIDPVARASVAAPVFETVAPGVLRIDSPLPFRGLKQVNLWLIEDHDGWTMVDCGYGSVEVRAQLEAAWDAALGGRPITRLVVTHFHPDHTGNCAWISQRWNLRPRMTSPEWMAGQLAVRDLFTDDLASSSAFFVRHGLSAEQIDVYNEGFILYSDCVALPESYGALAQDDALRIGGREWRVHVGGGHSPALAGLHCAELGVYIAGDQILPKITPNVSVVHWEPQGDPLALYQQSLQRLRAAIPDDVLVLPSHRAPFRGLHGRIDELEAHHVSRLDFIRALFDDCGSMTGAECMKQLFGFVLDGQQVYFAMGEALAHLNHLLALGELELVEDADAKLRYRKIRRA